MIGGVSRAARVLALTLALAGCEEEAREERAPNAPRGPHGQEPVRCEGASIDPPAIEMVMASAADNLPAAITSMEATVGANPGSATARVRLGELLLRTTPPQAALAQRFFARGLALHEEGCTLAAENEWRALEGAALSRMMQGDYEAAEPFLRRSLERWPGARSTRYNLACVRCRTGDLDGCERALRRVLDATGAPTPLPGQARPPGHYLRLIRTDSDLAALRADPERLERVLGAR